MYCDATDQVEIGRGTNLVTEVVDVCVVLHLHDIVVCLPDTICWSRVVASAPPPPPALGSIAIVHLVAVLGSPSHPQTRTPFSVIFFRKTLNFVFVTVEVGGAAQQRLGTFLLARKAARGS